MNGSSVRIRGDRWLGDNSMVSSKTWRVLSWLTFKDLEGAQLICILYWKFWKARNDAVFNNIVPDPIKIAAAAAEFVLAFNDVNLPRPVEDATAEAESAEPSQQFPVEQKMSLFVDAGTFEDGVTCWGLCVKDSNGEIIFSAYKRDRISVDPMLAEVPGLHWGIQTALQQNFIPELVLLDAEMVVKAFHSPSLVAVIGPIVEDCHVLLTDFADVDVQHVRRNRNVIAHNLVVLRRRIGCNHLFGPPPVNCNDPSVAMPVDGFLPRFNQ